MIMLDSEHLYNEEAELDILGAIVCKNALLNEYKLKEDYFYRAINKVIFEAMERLNNKKKPIDLVMLNEELVTMGKFDDIGGLATLINLTNRPLITSGFKEHLQVLRNRYLKRQMLDAINNVYCNLSSDKEIEEIVVDAQNRFNGLEFNTEDDNTQKLGNILAQVIDDLAKNSQSKYVGVETGFVDFDEITGGLKKGTFNVLAARPAMGKTAFALNIANRQAKLGKTVLVFSLEMAKEDLARRIISEKTGIEGTKLSNPIKLDPNQDWDKIWNVCSEMADTPMYINDKASMTPADILRIARDVQNKHGLDIIFLDYLQLANGNGKSSDRQQEVAEISRKMKMIAKELEVPIIALSQLSRGVEARTNKRPMLSDLRESGSIEQDADLVMFLYRDEYYNPDTEVPNTAELIIAKHRAGATGTVNLYFNAETTTFKSLSKTMGMGAGD